MKKTILVLSALTLNSNLALAGNGDLGSVVEKGRMKSVSRGSVQEGKNFEESLMTLEAKNDSLLLTLPKSSECKYSYTVKYDPSYLMTAAEKKQSPASSVPADCNIVKQGKHSVLAQFIFCEDKKTGSYDMTLGEGMPMLLGKFHPAKKEDVLQRDYEKIKKETAGQQKDPTPGESDDHLIAVDLNAAEAILKGKDTLKKIKTLEDLSSNLWTAKVETITKRMKLIELGMKDKNENVQENALAVFDVGGRVRSGIAPLKAWMKEFSSKSVGLQEKGATAATYLLYRAHRELTPIVKLKNKYKGSDLPGILKATGGVIDAEDANDFKEVCRANTWNTDTNFSEQDHAELRDLLLKIARDKKATYKAVKIAQAALKDYVLPAGTAAASTQKSKVEGGAK